jgi:redox-sensitive bicupin YhaK (pirin superfamily)
MPAVNADTLTLARVPRAGLGDVERPVLGVTTAPQGHEGEGFPVRRAFAGIAPRFLDPFIMMDQMGEVEYAPGEPKGTSWHPHRGFETVTYIMDGAFQHQDSHGGGGFITDGATQWMTAGGGILHIETPPVELVRSGGTFHGVQLWVNLPGKDKMTDPAYQNLEGSDVTLLASHDAGALLRLIAGDLPTGDGGLVRGPGLDPHPDHAAARQHHPRRAALAAVEARLQRAGVRAVRRRHGGRRLRPSAGAPDPHRADGRARRRRPDHARRRRGPGQQARRARGAGARRRADPRAGRAVRPVRHEHPRELQQAVEDFQAGRFGQIPPGALMPHTG